MKKFIVLIFLLAGFTYAKACDICGCGVGGYYIGLLPDFNKRFLGLRFQLNKITTQLDINGQRTALTTDETYRSTELWGAWNISNRWRILAIIPYSFNEKYTSGSDLLRKKDGLSDVVVNGYYQVFSSAKSNSSNKMIVHSLWAGLGLKLATGKYDVQEQNNAMAISPNIFQLGTGSFDFIPSVMYDFRIQDFGVNANASDKINTENKDHYRYGDKLAANASAYYKIALGNEIRIAPNAGVNFENQQKDHNNSFLVNETGGNIVNATAGLEANIKRLSVGVSFQTPMHQNLGQGRVDAGNRLLTHVSFSF